MFLVKNRKILEDIVFQSKHFLIVERGKTDHTSNKRTSHCLMTT